MSGAASMGATLTVPISTTVQLKHSDIARALAMSTSDVQADFLNVLAYTMIHACAPNGGVDNQLVHVAGGLSEATTSVLASLVWFNDNAAKTNVPEAVVARFEEKA